MKEPIIAPTAKLGENTEKILALVAGVEISETITLPTTPRGVRPTAISGALLLSMGHSQSPRKRMMCQTRLLKPIITAGRAQRSVGHSMIGRRPYRSDHLAHNGAIIASTTINVPSPNPA